MGGLAPREAPSLFQGASSAKRDGPAPSDGRSDTLHSDRTYSNQGLITRAMNIVVSTWARASPMPAPSKPGDVAVPRAGSGGQPLTLD
eukprot:scaffold29723_cov101-Isochrysis_galbana.AAC.2